jgi:hypothetical protein
MVDTKTLLTDLRKLVKDLTEDMLRHGSNAPATATKLQEQYKQHHDGGRISQSFEEWREDYVEQVAVAWVIACIFVRFIEDNDLINEGYIAGEGERGKLAEGEYTIYFRRCPHDTDREYLKNVFREIGKLPAAADIFSEKKNPLWAVDPSGDAARNLLKFFQEMSPEDGSLRRSFCTKQADSVRTRTITVSPLVQVYQELAPQARFLGDLYQDLSEHAQKKYALKQTPEFVQQFILDRTLTRAIDEFGLKNLRLIDPACGSGHFLLGAFDRLFEEWIKPDNFAECSNNVIVAADNAFNSLHGVDINPFAIAITRFRLFVAAVQACGIDRLNQQTQAWKFHVAVGDSLLRGSRPNAFGNERVRIQERQLTFDFEETPQFAFEEARAANDILDKSFHVVVGNPPYITVKDRSQNEAYRHHFREVCHQKFSLGVPFTQRFWELAIRQGERINPECDKTSPTAGFVGMITANSFMKRDFGKKLVEEFFPKTDLTHVLDTSGAYIPGHGTPTVILFGRARRPVEATVRAVLGIKGEPNAPENPAQGKVWQSIVGQIDRANSRDEFTSATDVLRSSFCSHPWTIGGGGVNELVEVIEGNATSVLADVVESIGITSFTLEDEVFIVPRRHAERLSIPTRLLREMVIGESLRDWHRSSCDPAVFPYDSHFVPIPKDLDSPIFRYLWRYRASLSSSKMFGGRTKVESGLNWYEYGRLTADKLRSPLSIAFAFVASHNHFVLDHGGRVFNRTAPVIKLIQSAGEKQHLEILGLLNSSTACFWMKQVFFPKGGDHVGQQGARVRRTWWDERYEFAATQMQRFPLPDKRPLELARELHRLGEYIVDVGSAGIVPSKASVAKAEQNCQAVRSRMVALQEELDWQCYQFYGLLSEDLCYNVPDLPDLNLGERAFEIVMARQIVRDELKTTWFERHGSTAITEVPSHWPDAYRSLVDRRIRAIETNTQIGLIEKPEYKRRWNSEPWEEQTQRALKQLLLDRLESRHYWPDPSAAAPTLQTTAQLADKASIDLEFMDVAGLYKGRADFDVGALVAELVTSESVPFLPILRYKAAGLRKREVWGRTWELQRSEDAGRDAGTIPVPPKYTSADFCNSDYYRLRGKLDVPKERWISYPHCSTESDPSLLVGWAGWNHLQQATALVSYYDARKREGWDAHRLAPLLAGIDQLLPWIHQWHPEIDPEFGETAGRSFQTMLAQDAHELGLTLEEIRAWAPTTTARQRARKKR